MLESLRQGSGSIHELNLAGAFPARAVYRPRELYEALKATPLFDAEGRQWNTTMTKAQTLQDNSRDADVQLLGVLVEALFNLEGAQALYEELKATPLYDSASGEWNQRIFSVSQTQMHPERYAATQLLGVLVEAQFNPGGARLCYEKLKTVPVYDAERGEWNEVLGSGMRVFRLASVQLLAVLVEQRFEREEARALYETLQSTPCYDAAYEQWNLAMKVGKTESLDIRNAEDQLLGVLAEAHCNPEKARQRYENLTATPLYDPERGQWIGWMNTKQQLRETVRNAAAQLLGVLVEAKLLATLPCSLTEPVPPLPITEEW